MRSRVWRERSNGGTQIADEQFQYDGVGNRTASTSFGPSQPNTTVSYSYNAANELTSNAVNGGTATTYSYDGNGNGNLTGSSAGLAIAYNAKNQTTSMTVNGATTSFGYTGTDQTERVTKTTASGTEAYLNTALGVTRETGPSGLSYERDNHGGLISKTPDGSNYYYYLLDGLPARWAGVGSGHHRSKREPGGDVRVRHLRADHPAIGRADQPLALRQRLQRRQHWL